MDSSDDRRVIYVGGFSFAEERRKMTPEELADYEAMLVADHAGDEEEAERLFQKAWNAREAREAREGGSQRSA